MKLIRNTAPSKIKAIAALVVLILGVGMVPTNILLNNMVQSEINQGIADQITVPDPDDEEAYDIWKAGHHAEDAPSSYTSYYMWNLTNPDDVLQGEKPIYQEIGPYTFQVYTYKYNVKFSDDEEEVSYNSYSRRDYRPGKSGVGLTLEDNITNINPGYLGVLEEMGSEDELRKEIWSIILETFQTGFEEEFINNIPLIETLLGLFSVPHWVIPSAKEVLFCYWANDSAAPVDNLGEPDPTNIVGTIQSLVLSTLRANGDIDGRYGFVGTPPHDVNISIGPVYQGANIISYGNPSGLNFTQCDALWDSNVTNSLSNGTLQIWLDAIDGDITSQNTLKTAFNLTTQQLSNITTWIDASLNRTINGWITNLAIANIEGDLGSGLITTRTAEEWLFTAVDGLVNEQDPVRAHVNIFSNIHNVWEAMEKGTDRYTIKTGKGDINEVCQRVEFNGQDEITIWAEPIDVKGTGGTQFAPGISQDDELEVFSSDFMRTLEFDFHRTTSIYDIELYQFKFDDGTFEPNPDYYMCIDGCANVYPCQGIPAYLSKPHFLDGDPILTSSVSGMKPNKEDHDTYFEVEPITGITMKGRTRMQVNFMTSQTDLWYPNITEAMMPIVWFEDRSEITEELAEDFKDLVYGALDLQQNLNLLTLGAAAAFGVPGAIFTTTQAIKRKKLKAR